MPPVANYDRELALSAYRKAVKGEALSDRERVALKRHEKAREEELRWKYYRSIPQKHWRAMSGRQTKVLQEQAARYGIPFDRAQIDLPSVIRAIHEFLAVNGRKLFAENSSGKHGAVTSPALEWYRREKARLARYDRLERERTLLPREQVHVMMMRIANLIRCCGEDLQRRFGTEAMEILNDTLDEVARQVDEELSEKIRSFDEDDRPEREPRKSQLDDDGEPAD